MVELLTKLVLVGAVLLSGFLTGRPDFASAGKIAAIGAAVAAFSYLLEQRNLRNRGIAGFLAVADSFLIAFTLQGAGLLDRLGFLVLVPCAYAAAKSHASAVSMAPLAAAGMLAAHVSTARDLSLAPALMAHVLGVLAVGLWLGSGENTPSIQPAPLPQIEEVMETASPDLEQTLVLRESFRQLREAYNSLESKSKRDHILGEILSLRVGTPQSFPARLLNRLQEWTGARAVTLYTVATYDEALVIRATTDTSHQSAPPVEVDLRQNPARIVGQLDSRLAARWPGQKFINVPLTHKGRLQALVSISDEDSECLQKAVRLIEPVSQDLGAALYQEVRREHVERRLRESEILYNVVSLADGAESRASAAARIIAELSETLELGHLSVALIDEGQWMTLATEGQPLRLIDQMSFSSGPGLKGWLATGAPELLMFDVRSDSRCDAGAALKARVGSFFAIPLTQEHPPLGVLTAASPRPGGLDVAEAEILRAVATELGRCLIHLRPGRVDAEGILTPKQFQEKVASQSGHLIVLELLRRDQAIEVYGRSALNHALRTFSRRVRARLPEGGALCKRGETDLIAFHPTSKEGNATSWANEIAAAASMIGLRTPDGSAPMPLAFRAKVAKLSPQTNQVSGHKAS